MWRSALVDSHCPGCQVELQSKLESRKRELALRQRLVSLGGGAKPFREFRFESYDVTTANQLAFSRTRTFNPARDNFYLWGPCGVGKTHLAFAAARRFCEEGRAVEFLKPPQLMRRVRLKEPDDEQQAINRLARAEVFVLDDLGIGSDTAYARQIFQEILDGREYNSRNGLLVTSKYSLDALASKLGDDSITSRLAGLCEVIEVEGVDRRLAQARMAGNVNAQKIVF